MKVFLFAAHGSRREESNQEVDAFFNMMFKNIEDKFDKGICCFLQFGRPLFEETLEEVLSQGGRDIYIFPYFLFNGSHVTVDIPEITKGFMDKNPDVSIKILKALGDLNDFHGFLSNALIDEIEK